MVFRQRHVGHVKSVSPIGAPQTEHFFIYFYPILIRNLDVIFYNSALTTIARTHSGALMRTCVGLFFQRINNSSSNRQTYNSKYNHNDHLPFPLFFDFSIDVMEFSRCYFALINNSTTGAYLCTIHKLKAKK